MITTNEKNRCPLIGAKLRWREKREVGKKKEEEEEFGSWDVTQIDHRLSFDITTFWHVQYEQKIVRLLRMLSLHICVSQYHHHHHQKKNVWNDSGNVNEGDGLDGWDTHGWLHYQLMMML